jgi:erythromycin esterase
MAIVADRSPYDSATPLRGVDDFDPLMDRIGEARVVCIGEASHGTHEFYRWRALLTRRLVVERGFDLVAVEGDWPDCHRVSCSVTGAGSAPDDPRRALADFARWPTWMWANEEVAEFTRWLRAENLRRPEAERVGFYGLDVYSLWDSVHAVLEHLRENHPAHVEAALEACRCLEPYAEDPQAYARATRLVPRSCELEVVSMLGEVLERGSSSAGPAPAERDAAFVAEQNARAAVGAERYYRAMVQGGPASWNVRDTHMADTLDRLLTHHEQDRGAPAKAVVWEHNTHVGDARFTDMADAGLVNVGQLVRERYGERDSVLVGLGSHHGSVVAASGWGEPARRMTMPPARRGSIESLFHDTLGDRALFVFPEELPAWAVEEQDHRAVGVVYRPKAERWGNYVPTILGRRYDAFLWFDETTALQPLEGTSAHGEERETWPSLG